MMMLACAAAFCGGVLAEEAKTEAAETPETLAWAPGEGISFGEQPIMSTEVGLAFDSKFMSYGLVDNKDPIITPSAAVTFFDWLTFEVAALFDTTTYGRKAGYSNRGGRREVSAARPPLRPVTSKAGAFASPSSAESRAQARRIML